ncbi:hypothetical protein GCM10011512_14970 [Tersicoccus solisilvae]|uniref:Uncharacterized protein n=1 Tax=Tersicoccus solisilvae TaxID=1882339 RepID=A0ABQ1P4R6_9MICC|nr:hypothetical protein GCM10011512_14970 [Tersicoccus solisilvae]
MLPAYDSGIVAAEAGAADTTAPADRVAAAMTVAMVLRADLFIVRSPSTRWLPWGEHYVVIQTTATARGRHGFSVRRVIRGHDG